MDTQAQKVQYTSDHYRQFPVSLHAAKTLVNRSTGEVVKISDWQKIFYVEMRNQYMSFQSIGKDFFASQAKMADYFFVTEKHIQKSIKAFKLAGLVTVDKKVGGRSNIYTVHDIDAVVLQDPEGNEILIKNRKGFGGNKKKSSIEVTVTETCGEYDYPEGYFQEDNEVYVEDFIESIGG